MTSFQCLRIYNISLPLRHLALGLSFKQTYSRYSDNVFSDGSFLLCYSDKLSLRIGQQLGIIARKPVGLIKTTGSRIDLYASASVPKLKRESTYCFQSIVLVLACCCDNMGI